MNILEFKKKKQTLNKDRSNNVFSIPSGVSAIGIDLGTTNSVVSIFMPGENHPKTLSYENENLIPSLVYYNVENDEVIIGINANNFLEDQTAEVIKSTKRSMGKKFSVFYSNEKSFTAEETATLILKYIVSHPVLVAEKEKFGGIWAVITVPAHFDDAARMATISAAENAGIHVLRIINEPTAAALAYSMISDDEKILTENVAVFDFGGGTFDVSIVERNELTFNVLSSEGDVNLGGDDIDEILADFFLRKVQPPFVARRATKDSELYRKISFLAQEAKKSLQTEAVVHIQDNNLDGRGSTLDVEVERNEFEEMVFPILQKTIFLTESSIQSAKKSPKNISRILLVGGSTRLHLVRKMLSDYFPCQVDARLEPDLAVSWGASLQAAIILGIQVDTILVDVCNHTLGVGVVESTESAQDNFKQMAKKYGLSYPLSEDELQSKLGKKIEEFNLEVQSMLKVAPILYRNSPLPARKSEFFNTVYHNQSAVHVVVVQGEGDTVGENRLIGSFMFKLEQPCPKGSRCEIQLTYDVNGMVQVFARQLGTNNEARAHFDSRTGTVQGWSPISSDLERKFDKKIDSHPTHFDNVDYQNEHDEAYIYHSPSQFERGARSAVHTTPEAVHKRRNNEAQTVSASGIEPAVFKLTSLYSHGNDLEDISVINAIIMRAKRVLAKLEQNSQEYMHIFNLTKQYSFLLESVKEGRADDEQIEVIEEQLLTLLEGK